MKILVVRLQSDNRKHATCGYDFYQVIDESEGQFEVDVALCNCYINNKKFIPKIDTNKVKYVEMFTRIDDDECWWLDAYVYATIQNDNENERTINYWKKQLQEKVMQSIKDRNQLFKSLYYSVAAL